jgi:hypothetical protein
MKRRHFNLNQALSNRVCASAERIVGEIFWRQDQRRLAATNQPLRIVPPNQPGGAAPDHRAC